MLDLSTVQVIDTDSHVSEPADLWTSRVSKRWGDAVPHVRRYERDGEDRWFIGDEMMSPTGMFAMVGWPEIFPSHPPTLEDADPAVFDPVARLAKLDENGIFAQLIYPNLVGFFASRFMQLDPQLGIECTRAYNDFLSEYCQADPLRLIALTTLPFWDVDESVKEMERCKENGHKGVLFAHTFDALGLPNLPDEHWAPILDAAQSLDLPVNFHIGFNAGASDETAEIFADQLNVARQETVEQTALGFMSNARAITMLTVHGVCERYPRLKFVPVESGFGWIPFLLEALDWQWKNNAMQVEHPGWLLPSEYFRRQIYATMWFESPALEHIEAWQDNIMWETDYPHPTAQWPTPSSSAPLPAAEAIEGSLRGVSDLIRTKILHDNPVKVYGLDA